MNIYPTYPCERKYVLALLAGWWNLGGLSFSLLGHISLLFFSIGEDLIKVLSMLIFYSDYLYHNMSSGLHELGYLSYSLNPNLFEILIEGFSVYLSIRRLQSVPEFLLKS